MTKVELNKEYFDWMYHIVCNDKYYKHLSYKKLLMSLHGHEFTYNIDRDINRAIDGIDFRYRFGYENRYSTELISKYLNYRPCSILEMMISLSFRLEEQIMEDDSLGNRTGEWFWGMIVNLGLGSMDDSKFDEYFVNESISRFLNKNYSSNGKGGLFTINHPRKDIRMIEIWCQMMWYLDENQDYRI